MYPKLLDRMPEAMFEADCLDDLMHDVIQALLNQGEPCTARRGDFTEMTGVSLELHNPRARLSRTETRGRAISALGEFCWYLAGREDLASIEYYITKYKEEAENGLLPGAYGPRLIGDRDGDQVERVISLLDEHPTSRKAVIQLFDANDLTTGQKDVPCTCTLQLLLRGGKLHLIAYMRSNDAYLGLPHDVFCFTLLQEWIARRLGTALGTYKHFVGSLHLYDEHRSDASLFIAEGFQSTRSPMPCMPESDPVRSLRALLRAEEVLRGPKRDLHVADEIILDVNPYWGDLIRLLQVFRSTKDVERTAAERVAAIREIKMRMNAEVYYPFIDRQLDRLRNGSTP